MTSIVEIISYDNPVFRAYAFWSAILILKMLLMSYLTGQQRKKSKVRLLWNFPEISMNYEIQLKFKWALRHHKRPER